MNKLDKDFTALLQDILNNGNIKKDRTGTGTISVFGREIRHKMSEGFPLLTTKKMFFKGVVTELIWFLRGDTNIKYLVDNDCNIWNGDAYQAYLKNPKNNTTKIEIMEPDPRGQAGPIYRLLTIEEFVHKIKTDNEFAMTWGDLGPVYGKEWRNWGGAKEIFREGFLHKTEMGWGVNWSDTQSFLHGTDWEWTKIQDSDQTLYHDEDEGKKVKYEMITLSYDKKSFYPIQVTKVLSNENNRYFGSIDQITNLINDLKNNPDSRRLMVTAWNPADVPNQVLPPCHYGFQCYTRELNFEERLNFLPKKDSQMVIDWCENPSDEILKGFLDAALVANNIPIRTLSLKWNQRSVDTFLGLPFNIASYGLLLEILAKTVNMVPDELIGTLGDTHLYLNHIEQAKEQIGRDYTYSERFNILKEKVGPMGLNHDRIEEEVLASTPARTREPFGLPKLIHGKTDDFYKSLSVSLSLFGHLDPKDFKIEGYQSHPTIKASLSN